MGTKYDNLIKAAREARRHAYAPYSRFAVGAAVLADSGRVYPGANVENASYGLTICAERVALLAAVAAGERRFRAIAIVADTPTLAPPCGACRQMLGEFGSDTVVILANLHGQHATYTVAELLPHPFVSEIMDGPTGA